MTDPTKPTDPAPAPPADEEVTAVETPARSKTPVPQIAGVPLGMFVRGGTTTSAWDAEQHALDAQTDYLQSHQDQQRDVVRQVGEDGGGIASIASMNLMSRANPKVVIEYCYRDSALNQECLAELFTLPNSEDPSIEDMGLVIVCPKCLRRTGRQYKSQLMIRTNIRQFFLRPATDPDYPAEKRVWVNRIDGQVYQLAGTITTKDAISCTALGCTWKFRIDDSKLKEV